MTGTMLIVGMITPHLTHLTITKTRTGRPRPDPGCSATDDDDDDSERHAIVGSLPLNRNFDYLRDSEFRQLYTFSPHELEKV
jgi:hypothetical protein